MIIISKQKKKPLSYRRAFITAALLSTVAVPLIVYPTDDCAAALFSREKPKVAPQEETTKKSSMIDQAGMSDGMQDYKSAGKQKAPEPAIKLGLSGHVATLFSVGIYDHVSGDVAVNNFAAAIPVLSFQATGETTTKNEYTGSTMFGAAVRAKIKPASLASNGSDNGSVIFDRAYIYAQNQAGQVQLGSTDNPSHFMHYTSPWYMVDNGLDDPNFINTANSVPVRQSTYANMSRRSNKVSYYTPRISGLQVGVAFTPDSQSLVASSSAAPQTKNATTGLVLQILDVAGNYAFQYDNKYDVGVDGFFSIAFSSYDVADRGTPMEMGVGAQLGYHLSYKEDDVIRIGGAFYYSRDIMVGTYNFANKGDNMFAYTVGVEYEVDRLTVGAAFIGANSTSKSGSLDSLRNLAAQVGASYKIEEGVRVGLDLNYTNAKDSNKTRNGYAVNVSAGVDF